jgi:hypothetical protein
MHLSTQLDTSCPFLTSNNFISQSAGRGIDDESPNVRFMLLISKQEIRSMENHIFCCFMQCHLQTAVGWESERHRIR